MVGAFCRTYSIREAIDKFLKDVYEPSAMEGRYDYIPADSSAGVIIIWIPLREGISSMVPVRLILEKRVPSDVHRYAIWKFGVNALAKSVPILSVQIPMNCQAFW